jgi:polar amino acid transport system substrate-binding protein
MCMKMLCITKRSLGVFMFQKTKIFQKFTILCVSALFFANSFASDKTITVATDEFPGGWAHKDGSGIYLEVLTHIYEAKGYKLNFVFAPFARIISMTQSGQADMYAGAYYNDADNILYPAIENYFGEDLLMAVFDGKKNSYNTEESLRNKRVAWRRGYGIERYIKVPMQITEVNTLEIGVNLLKAGRIDYYIDVEGEYEEEYPELLSDYSNEKIMSLNLYHAFGTTPKAKQLLEIYNAEFPKMKQNGFLDALYKKWGVE